MKFLDAIKPTRSNGAVEQRYGMDDWIHDVTSMMFDGRQYPVGLQTSYGHERAETIANSFSGYVQSGLKGNGVIFSLMRKRLEVFSQARFQFQALREGRPGKLYRTPELEITDFPWPGGSTGDLLSRAILSSDNAGNAYIVRVNGQLIVLRPDWVEIILTPREVPYGANGEDVPVGYEQVGIFYYEGGIYAGNKPAVFLPGEYVHFAPYPDPEASYRGMSWLTPVIRELQADTMATKHKLKFFENAATPNLAVSLPKELTPTQFKEFVELMNGQTKGVQNAYKTLFTGGGADVTVIGADMRQLDFKVTQGAGETRLAMAAGIHPVVVGMSESMQGSSLNAGNYNSAKRSTVDTTMRYLWQNFAGSLATIINVPSSSRLWYDARDIPFLLDDMKERAEIQSTQASANRQLVDAGYEPESIVAALLAEDWSLLKHSGLYSVQLQPPGTQLAVTSGGKNGNTE